MRLASLTMSPLLQTIGSGSHGLQKLLSHHAASHLHAFPTLSLLPRMPFSCFSLANSSFETRLRGPLQDALPAPSRLGKMPPVCIFITELINSSHVLCHGLIHVCPAPPHPHQGKGQLLCLLHPCPMSTTENVWMSEVFSE